MSKRIVLLSLTALSLGLTACQEPIEETQETVEQIETTEPAKHVDDSSEENDREDVTAQPEESNHEEEYAKQLDHAKAQLDSDQLDAAAGTLSALLQNDLSAYPDLQTEAETLKAEIEQQQAEAARQVAGASTESSDYSEERQSSIITEQFEAETGKALTEASDEELGAWLDEREQENEPAGDLSKEETEDLAFSLFLNKQALTSENYFYFVNQEDAEWVQIEAREAVEQDGVEWSNLIGLYRVNIDTEDIQKLDSVSGVYESVE